MKKYLEKIKPVHYPYMALLLTCIVYFLVFSYMGLLSNGKYVIARADMFQQYLPFINTWRDILRGDKSYWFSWNVNMGDNTALFHAYYTISPFNVIYLLFGETGIMKACAWVTILKAGTAAFICQISLRKILRQEGFQTVLFAMMYALCGFQIAYHFIPSWMDALYLYPLILWLLVRLVREGKSRALLAVYTYLFVTNFYMGYMTGICSFFFFLFYLLYAKGKAGELRNNRIDLGRLVLRLIGSVLMAAGISSIVWLPAAAYLFTNMSDFAELFQGTYCNPLFIYNNLFMGQMQTLQGITPFVYCGIPVLILLPCYFFNQKISRRERLYALLMLALLMACMLITPLNRVMHAFDEPNMLRYRYAFCFSFLLVLLACRQSVFLKTISRNQISLLVGVSAALYIAAKLLYDRIFVTTYHGNTIGNFILSFTFIGLWIVTAACYRKRRIDYVTFFAAAAMLLSAELVVNGGVTFHKMEQQPLHESDYLVWHDLTEKTLEGIKAQDSGWYRINCYKTFNKNSGVWFDFQGLSNFTSAANRTLMHTMSDLGLYVNEVILNHAGMTPVTKLLFGVKYEFDFGRGLRDLTDSNTAKTELSYVKNEEVLGLGYMVDQEILEYQPEPSPFQNQNHLLSSMTGEEVECFTGADSVELSMENGKLVTGETVDYLEAEDSEKPAVFTFRVEPREDRPVYGYFKQPLKKYTAGVTVIETNKLSNEDVTVPLDLYPGRIIELGTHEDAYELEVLLEEGSEKVDFYNTYFTYFQKEELTKAYELLKDNQMNEVKQGKASAGGTVLATEDKPILFTTIPYSTGWEVSIDGKNGQIIPLAGNAFCGVSLQPGRHQVNFTYRAPFADVGLSITVLSLLLTALLCSQSISRRHPCGPQHNRKQECSK